MRFCDLNLSSSAIETRALELGYSYAKPARPLRLDSPRDVKRVGGGEVVAVESLSTELLRACAKRDCGLLLLNPFSVPSFYKDEGLVRSVAEASSADSRNCAFEIPYSLFLTNKFVYRARLISQAQAFLRACVKLRAPFVIVSRAANVWQLKSPREAIAMGMFYGLSYEQAAYALGTRPQAMLEEAMG